MKILIFLVINLAAIINYQEWQINNNFSVRFSDRYADGYFENLSGRIIFDSANLPNASFNVEVTTASINTGNKLKNKHAKSEKWLDAERFPTIHFISDSVYKNGCFYVRGDLRIKDAIRKIIIPFEFINQGDSSVFEGAFKIDRASYGLGKSTNDEKDSATIWIRVPVTMKNSISFDKQGHRGCRGLMPENTIPAMLKAIDLGVTTLEMDVVFTSDQQAILSHEPFFNHEITTKPDGSLVDSAEEKLLNIYHMKYADVQKFDVGLKPHPRFPHQVKIKAIKPLLSAVIDSSETQSKKSNRPLLQYNIETKTDPATDNVFHPAPGIFVEQLMKVINEQNISSRITVQSFDIRTLQYLHTHYPVVRTSLLIEHSENKTVAEKIKELGFTPSVISPEFQMVTRKLVRELHDKKIKIIPWTVNNAAEINALKEMNVDGIISDYPDLF